MGKRRIKNALGIGSAYGDEFKPIATMIDYITILDPSDAFSDVHEIFGTPCRYMKPNSDGSMSFDINSFDLITSFGVMHHIPNVTHVMKECYRCLNNSGTMLVREPIVSMGDWTKARPGLTKRERGIPFWVFNDIINEVGFKIKKKSFCVFPVIPRIANNMCVSTYNNVLLTLSDALICRIFSWNKKYHRTKMYQKFGPSSVFFVLEK